MSGDLISSGVAAADRVIGGAQQEDEDLQSVATGGEDDNVSIISESSIGSAIYDVNNDAPQLNDVRQCRRRRPQVELLGQPVEANMPRLRSGIR